MASLTKKREQNIAGDFYVDSSCIDCDTCRWMAPDTFHRDGSQSAVHHQPVTEEERLRSLQALLSCPTASIGTVEKPQDIRQVQQSFPIPIADNVYHCGYHSEASFAASSYLIQHPEGNILIDSPRFTPPLVKQIEAIGGIRWMYLTHKDDIADHQKYHDHFGCQRILHEKEITAETRDVEKQLTSFDPFQLYPDCLIIPVPGHSEGHTVLLYQDKFLFSGDHIAWSARMQQLIGFRNYCWDSWPKLIESTRQLKQYTFSWILPGHGRRYHADIVTMQQELDKCIAWMETV